MLLEKNLKIDDDNSGDAISERENQDDFNVNNQEDDNEEGMESFELQDENCQYESEEKEELSFDFIKTSPNSFYEIMRTYVTLTLHYSVERINRSIAESLNYERGNTYDKELRQLKQKLEMLKVDNIVCSNFKAFSMNGCQNVSEQLDRLIPNSLPITKEIVNQIISPIKDLFVIEGGLYSKEITTSNLKMIIFPACGYPLYIESRYNVNFVSRETIVCYNAAIFSCTLVNDVPTNQLCNSNTEVLQCVLFNDEEENIDNQLRKFGCQEEHIEPFKNLLVYCLLQNAFGSHKFQFFESVSGLNWLPYFPIEPLKKLRKRLIPKNFKRNETYLIN